MRIDSTIWKTPHEGHDKTEPVVLINCYESNGQDSQNEHDAGIANACLLWTKLVNQLSNQLTAKELTHS